MARKPSLRVKICCVSSASEAELAIKLGATALGLVSQMPSGPGIIKEDQIKHILNHVQHDIDTFLLTSKTDPVRIIHQCQKLNPTHLQLVDRMKLSDYAVLREALPSINLVQVVHVIDDNSVDYAKKIAPFVDALLLDSGNPNLDIKVLGGTGKTHNWDLSKRIKASVQIPIYLAGGLNASNIGAAIQHVQPDGVDLCSGVRTHDHLDEVKLKAFFHAIPIAP